MGAVNCDAGSALCQKHGVQGYPTIMAFVNGKAAGEYSGERSAGAIKTWALGLVPNHVTTLNKQQQVDEFLRRCGGSGSGSGKQKPRADWGACVLLFTAKHETSPLALSLANQYRDKLAFGEVRGGNAALGSAFGVKTLPALLVVCNGDAATREAYSGDMKSDPIRGFLDQFAGGKRCRQAVKITPETDFSRLKVGQLKELLRDRGLSCRDCFEKADFISKLRELAAAQT